MFQVKKGYKIDKEVFREFVDNWDVKDPNYEISYDEFVDYYKVFIF